MSRIVVQLMHPCKMYSSAPLIDNQNVRERRMYCTVVTPLHDYMRIIRLVRVIQMVGVPSNNISEGENTHAWLCHDYDSRLSYKQLYLCDLT